MRSTQSVKLIDVAHKAGVSSSAAGKVLNGGSDEIRVGQAARERILAAAAELHYHRNQAASVLAGGVSRLIGILLDSGADYRYYHLLQRIESVCRARGYRLVTSFTHDNIADMYENYCTMQRYGIAGAICCAHDYPDLRAGVGETFKDVSGLVFMEKPSGTDGVWVGTSRRRALRDMVAHALSCGHRRIGMISGSSKWQSERLLQEEFRDALQANGMEVNENLIMECPEGIQNVRERCQVVMERMVVPHQPDFLYVDDASHAVPLVHMVMLSGSDVTIYGGNDDPLFAALNLGSLDPCYDEIAEALVSACIQPAAFRSPVIVESRFAVPGPLSGPRGTVVG